MRGGAYLQSQHWEAEVGRLWIEASMAFIGRPCLKKKSQALVAHTCNPSHSGGSDQEDNV
jgi:hypothetical protein